MSGEVIQIKESLSISIPAQTPTDGPWQVDGGVVPFKNPDTPDIPERLIYSACISPVSTNYRGTIAYIQSAEHIGGITKEEAEANAYLLCAARELYEALERIILYHGASISSDCAHAADRALAKARGEARLSQAASAPHQLYEHQSDEVAL